MFRTNFQMPILSEVVSKALRKVPIEVLKRANLKWTQILLIHSRLMENLEINTATQRRTINSYLKAIKQIQVYTSQANKTNATTTAQREINRGSEVIQSQERTKTVFIPRKPRRRTRHSMLPIWGSRSSTLAHSVMLITQVLLTSTNTHRSKWSRRGDNTILMHLQIPDREWPWKQAWSLPYRSQLQQTTKRAWRCLAITRVQQIRILIRSMAKMWTWTTVIIRKWSSITTASKTTVM